MKLVEFEELENSLRIILLPEGKEWLKDYPNTEFDELVEYQLCNGWDWITPEEIGALTSAPIIGKNVVDDTGLISVDEVYAYMDYQIFDPVEELFTEGEIILRKG